MKRRLLSKIVGMMLILNLATGCDHFSPITSVQNHTGRDIFISYTLGKNPSDSIVFNRYSSVAPIIVRPHHGMPILLMNMVLNRQPDSSKVYLYIFNTDSLDKYSKAAGKKGIYKQSLIRKEIIQLNKVKDPVDTIFIK